MIPPPPSSTLFPYTTLFRSLARLHLRGGSPHIVTTRAFDWPGLRLEAGMNNIVSVDEVSGVHHYVSIDRKSTRLNSSHSSISYAVFCLKKKNNTNITHVV